MDLNKITNFIGKNLYWLLSWCLPPILPYELKDIMDSIIESKEIKNEDEQFYFDSITENVNEESNFKDVLGDEYSNTDRKVLLSTVVDNIDKNSLLYEKKYNEICDIIEKIDLPLLKTLTLTDIEAFLTSKGVLDLEMRNRLKFHFTEVCLFHIDRSKDKLNKEWYCIPHYFFIMKKNCLGIMFSLFRVLNWNKKKIPMPILTVDIHKQDEDNLKIYAKLIKLYSSRSKFCLSGFKYLNTFLFKEKNEKKEFRNEYYLNWKELQNKESDLMFEDMHNETNFKKVKKIKFFKLIASIRKNKEIFKKRKNQWKKDFQAQQKALAEAKFYLDKKRDKAQEVIEVIDASKHKRGVTRTKYLTFLKLTTSNSKNIDIKFEKRKDGGPFKGTIFERALNIRLKFKALIKKKNK